MKRLLLDGPKKHDHNCLIVLKFDTVKFFTKILGNFEWFIMFNDCQNNHSKYNNAHKLVFLNPYILKNYTNNQILLF